MVMPFGKYEGKDLTEIPKRYLQWLRTQKWVAAWLVREIDNALSDEPDYSDEEALEKLMQAKERWR